MMWLTGTQTQVLQAAKCVFSLADDLVVLSVLDTEEVLCQYPVPLR